jgi:hypothetical protein
MAVWYPGAFRVNGARATYDRGFNRMEVVKCHYTVGVNSYPVGVRGYFQFLVNRDGTIYQFAPVDALCWDSGEWNDAGPGIEIEYHPDYHDVIFTQLARESTRGLAHWLHEEHGFPLHHWGGDRISEYAGFRGFIDHADLVQSEQHYDYWPAADVAYILGDHMAEVDLTLKALADVRAVVGGERMLNGEIPTIAHVLDAVVGLAAKVTAPPAVDVKALAAELARILPADVDADPRAIAEAVRDEFAANPLR